MKKLLLIIAAISTLNYTVSQTMPTSSEIWDFEVGDRFQYYESYSQYDTNYKNVEVIEKSTSGQVLTYTYAIWNVQFSPITGAASYTSDTTTEEIDLLIGRVPLKNKDSLIYFPNPIYDTSGAVIPDSCISQYIYPGSSFDCATLVWDLDTASWYDAWRFQDKVEFIDILCQEDSVWTFKTRQQSGEFFGFLGGYSVSTICYARGLGSISVDTYWADDTYEGETIRQLRWYQKANGHSCGSYFPLGIEELNVQVSTAIYPNPTSGLCWFKQNEVIGKKIEVFNVWGEKVLSVRISTMHLDLSILPSGFYSLLSEDGKSYKVARR